MAKLVVLTKGFEGTACELKAERTTIGRLEDNDLQIPEPSVSSHHCEILRRGNQIFVKDLDSTNGTYVNDRKFKEGPIRPDQKLRLGEVEIRLVVEGAEADEIKKQSALPPGGVKLNELEQGTKVLESPFAKKSNKINRIFVYVGIGLGAIIIGFLIYAVAQL